MRLLSQVIIYGSSGALSYLICVLSLQFMYVPLSYIHRPSLLFKAPLCRLGNPFICLKSKVSRVVSSKLMSY